jgi:hypothetical protein
VAGHVLSLAHGLAHEAGESVFIQLRIARDIHKHRRSER